MGTRYKLYTLQEIEVINDFGNIKTLEEVLDLGSRFYPISKYFESEYGFYQEEKSQVLYLDLEEINKLLEIIQNKTIFKYCDKDEWFSEYGNYYYDDILGNGKYIEFNWNEDTETIKTFDSIIKEFYKDLENEILDSLKDYISDNVQNYYFKIVWED